VPAVIRAIAARSGAITRSGERKQQEIRYAYEARQNGREVSSLCITRTRQKALIEFMGFIGPNRLLLSYLRTENPDSEPRNLNEILCIFIWFLLSHGSIGSCLRCRPKPNFAASVRAEKISNADVRFLEEHALERLWLIAVWVDERASEYSGGSSDTER
jgi:hypothetical protein